MKKANIIILIVILLTALCACKSTANTDVSNLAPTKSTEQPTQSTVKPTQAPTSEPSSDATSIPSQDTAAQQEEGRGDLMEESVPEGADVITQGVYYYELAEFSGDYGDGLSPREGAELTNDLLTDIGLYSDSGGISVEQCVYITLDELAILDSAMGHECYVYSVGLGTPGGGLMGDDYQVIYRISVDYGVEKRASIYEDFSGEYDGEGRGDLITDADDTFALTLYADFSGGSPMEDMIHTKDISLPLENTPASQSLIAFTLADGLSEWTGLDFTLNDVTFGEDSVIVDWSATSTLIAGLDDREQKEDFQFFDAVSLNWFMMDSLAQTLKHNLQVSMVYYCSNGGQVTFTNPKDMAAQGLPELPIDQPYEGSAFFVAHSNTRD